MILRYMKQQEILIEFLIKLTRRLKDRKPFKIYSKKFEKTLKPHCKPFSSQAPMINEILANKYYSNHFTHDWSQGPSTINHIKIFVLCVVFLIVESSFIIFIRMQIFILKLILIGFCKVPFRLNELSICF